jgi:LysR family hydrogen peroxide-inducible transcriptional activator
VEPFLEEELLLALPDRHPLAGKRRITFADLNGHSFILLSEMHCLGQQILSLCREESCRPVMICRSAQLLTVQRLVSAGHGISLVPEMACGSGSGGRRRYRHLSGARPTRTLAMIWHKQRYQRDLVRQFVELLARSPATRTGGRGGKAVAV